MVRLYAHSKRIPLTDADPLRLHLIEGAENSPNKSSIRRPRQRGSSPLVTNPFDAIEEHVGSVYRYALRLTGRPDLAEDLAQDTLLRGWRKRHSLRDSRAARVWLLQIATNLWTDYVRRRPETSESLVDDARCTDPPPFDAANHRENVRLAFAAMDDLPPRQRQVLYLVTCEALANGEVATVLEISEAAVKANLSLARKEMRRRLKELYEEVCGRPKVNHGT